ncbi:MAG: polyprenyl diphosphate synthase [Cellvibrionaceae bacterium]
MLKHLAIIMDGNNRWAKQRHLPGTAGHKVGIERLRDVLRGCKDHGIQVLTVFAFSSENWRRPPKEVSALMSLFYHYLKNEAKKLKKESVCLRVVGNREQFDKKLLKAITDAEKLTAGGERTLVIAADYGGQWDIVNAAKGIAKTVEAGALSSDSIDEDLFHSHTAISDLPPVDLLIRTGGEYRISNFLLWQSAYAELYFSELLWPDFDSQALAAAVGEFASRQRRFGLSGDQVKAASVNANSDEADSNSSSDGKSISSYDGYVDKSDVK